jgi:DNA-binding transcriptional ArsR family regulator
MALYVPREVALAHPVRERILQLVELDPDLNMKDLAGRLGCQPSTLIWHYTKLVRAGLLLTRREGNERVFRLPAGATATPRGSFRARSPTTPWPIDAGFSGPGRSRQ